MSRPNPNSNTNEQDANTNEQDEEARGRLELELRFILRTSEWVLGNFWSFQPGTDNINCRCNQCNTNDHDDKGKS